MGAFKQNELAIFERGAWAYYSKNIVCLINTCGNISRGGGFHCTVENTLYKHSTYINNDVPCIDWCAKWDNSECFNVEFRVSYVLYVAK